MKHIYVLELEDDCYYVGMTGDFLGRMWSHFNGGGSQWTKLHKAIRIMRKIRVKDERASELEKTITIEMMDKHGWERVRGGPWCSVGSEVIGSWGPMPTSFPEACFLDHLFPHRMDGIDID